MARHANSQSPKGEDIARHYASGYEESRLNIASGKLDRERSRELLKRFLPPAPATILDVGGGPGGHACWLAAEGHEVHLIDITPLHVEMAQAASRRQPEAPLASATVGDACSLSGKAGSVDAVVLFGPLYHLTDREDRLQALREAHRVLKPGGVLLGIGISRFASMLDGVSRGVLKDADFANIVNQDLENGHHRNPTGREDYFMDAFFHRPDELRSEAAEAGYRIRGIFGVEGPGWLVHDFDEWWNNPEHRARLLHIARIVETEPCLLGMSAHMMVAGSKP